MEMAKSTKELARELGLLRKRPMSATSPRLSLKKHRANQIFAYLIVIDFESTCWENDKISPQEIIEFPAVLLNTGNGKIESEFHYYLQPSERPSLSDFCHQLTGITQSQVDNGIPLSLCLRKFAGWLRKLREEKGIVCADDKNTDVNSSTQGKIAAFVTWSDWDLGVCLLYEAQRKQITRPSALDRWIDLRLTYRKFYSRRPDGLNGALKDLGIKFDGREHSGLDDARNTARLAWRMICDGCVMAITKTVKMNNAGKVERLSFPPSTPTLANVKSLQHNNWIIKSSERRKSSPRTKTPFIIAQDDSHLSPNGTVHVNHNAKKGLSERNLNVSPAPSQVPAPKTMELSNTSTNVHSCFNVSTAVMASGDCFQSKMTSISKIPVLKSGWKLESYNQPIDSQSFQMQKDTPPVPDCVGDASASSHTIATKSVPVQSMPSSSSPSSSSPSSAPASALSQSSSVTLPALNSSSQSLSATETKSLPLTVITNSDAVFKTPTTVSVSKTNGSASSSSTTFTGGSIAQNSSKILTTPKSSLVTPKHDKSTAKFPGEIPKTTPSPLSSSSFVSTSFSTRALTNTHNSSIMSFKTPVMANLNHSISSNMKATPPLCACGLRSKRRIVQKQGPNTGRFFFCCSNGSHPLNKKHKTGCGFFKWESPNDESRTGKAFKPVLQPITASQRSLGVRNVTCIR